ncbi:MAG: hypothetical protein AAFX99_16860 [Myxococcota bacterium]
MKLYRTIANHDQVPEGIYTRTFRALDGSEQVILSIKEGHDPVVVTWSRSDGTIEEHTLPAETIAALAVQRHTKAEGSKVFDVSKRTELEVSFQKLTPCDIVDLDVLRS